QPLYVCWLADLGPEILADFGNPDFLGLTADYFDQLLRPWLTWRGPGPAMLLNDFGIRDCAGDDFAHAALDVAIHEAGHILERGDIRTKADASTITLQGVCAAQARHSEYPSFDWHSTAWARIVVHLRQRAGLE